MNLLQCMVSGISDRDGINVAASGGTTLSCLLELLEILEGGDCS
jgi:hypothetical protein